MLDGDTETDPLDGGKIGLVAVERRNDGIDALLGADVIQHIDVFQGRGIVLAVAPELFAVDGDRVGNAEIVEGTEELFLQSFRETNLGGKAVAKVGGHVVTIHPLRGGGQAEEYLRGKVVEERPIAGSGAVVGLVNHDVIVEAASHLLPEAATGEHADGTEEVLHAIGLKLADQQFTEVLVAEDIGKGGLGLLENLLTMGHEEKLGLFLLLHRRSV